jgi:hypothetical protein
LRVAYEEEQMRPMICAIALSMVAAAPALAKDAPAPTETTKPARTVYVCDNSAMTRRAFEREHGGAEFVTAKDAATKGEAWAAPKCIKPAEARKLRDLAKR